MTCGVKVRTERDCCMDEDLLPYKGLGCLDLSKPKFCKHCWQISYTVRKTDAAGDVDDFQEYVIARKT